MTAAPLRTVARGRLLLYAAFGLASAVLAGLVRRHGDFDDAPLLLQLALGGMGFGWAVLVVVDVILHAWLGKGTPCAQCGHRRHLRPFRLAPPCPKCGA